MNLRRAAFPWLQRAAMLWMIAGACVAEKYHTREEALRMAFPNADAFESKGFIATNAQRERIAELSGTKGVSRFLKCFIAQSNDRTLGYAIVDETMGKHKPISYLLALTPDHRVRFMEILAYRESYGHEIRQKGFRRQFYGKSIEEAWSLNKDIQIITGATISCRSLIDAVREKLAFAEVLLPKLPAPDVSESDADSPLEKDLDESANDSSLCQTYVRRQLLMGTTLEIRACAEDRAQAQRAMTAAFAEVRRIEEKISSWIPESEISKLNREGFKNPVALSAETFQLLMRSREIWKQTEGRFDVTVGPLVQLWKQAERSQIAPDETSLAEAKSSVGMNHLILNADGSAAFKRPGMRVDFGGVGKGCAMDRAAEVLRRHGIASALLDFGGQLLALDPPPGKAGWEYAIRHPDSGEAPLAYSLLSNQASSTSGDYERGLKIGDRVYSHIVNPNTGLPAAAVRSVTVTADRAETVDAWSTALYLVPPETGLRFAREHGFQAVIFDHQGTLRRRLNEANSAFAEVEPNRSAVAPDRASR